MNNLRVTQAPVIIHSTQTENRLHTLSSEDVLNVGLLATESETFDSYKVFFPINTRNEVLHVGFNGISFADCYQALLKLAHYRNALNQWLLTKEPASISVGEGKLEVAHG